MPLLGLGLLAGCQASESQEEWPSGDPPSEDELQSIHEQFLDDAWRQVTTFFPDAQRPEVTTVRFISVHEWAQVKSDCLRELGFETQAMPDGGVSFAAIPAEQQESLQIASYQCEASYPIHPRLQLPLTDDEIDHLYRYLTVDLTTCLTAQGQRVPAAPSLEAYRSGTRSGQLQWSPYDEVITSSHEEWLDLQETCPLEPPDFRTLDSVEPTVPAEE